MIVHVCLATLPLAPFLIVLAAQRNLFGIVTLTIALLTVSLLSGSSPEPRRLNIGQIRTRAGLGTLARWLAVGLMGGGLVFGLVVGLMGGGLMFGLAFGLDDRTPHALGPRDVIRADGRFGLAGGLGGGLAFGLANFGRSWTRYNMAVVIAAARHRGPLRFGRFLDWAQRAGLLRISGVSYQFRHRELQDRLTGRQRPQSMTDRYLASAKF